VIGAALRLWCDKPSVGNGRTILSSLCSEVIKSRDSPPRHRNGSADQKGSDYLRLAAQLDPDNPTPELKALK